jgi:hypothetical protein
MVKIKVLAGLATIVSLMILATTPALAEFVSRNGTGTGNFTSPQGTFNVQGGFTLFCPKDEGTWKIRVAGTQYESQKEATTGPHLLVHVKVNNCMAKLGSTNLGTANVGGPGTQPECQLELKQSRGGLIAVGDVDEECIIKVPSIGCEIKFAKLNETTGENYQLSKITLETKKANTIAKGLVTGISQTPSAGCVGLKAGANGTLQGEEISEEMELI